MKKLLPIVDQRWTLFLDRDGTINRRLEDDYVSDFSQFEFLPGVLESIAFFNQVFGRVVIVTNQQGIGKEIMTHQDLSDIHTRMLVEMNESGARIDQIYYAPDLAVYDAVSRKPNPGMAIQAQEDFPEIEFRRSIMIGDADTDILFGNQLEMFTVRLDGASVESEANLQLPSLYDFYKLLLEEVQKFDKV